MPWPGEGGSDCAPDRISAARGHSMDQPAEKPGERRPRRGSALADGRASESPSPAPDVDHQVDDEGEPGVEVPPVEGLGQRQPGRRASAPVHHARHEQVRGEEEEQEVRGGKTDPPLDERLGTDDLTSHAGNGVAALGQVDDHQPDEDQTDNGVDGDPHVQVLQGDDRRRRRADQPEMDRESRSSAPRRTAQWARAQ